MEKADIDLHRWLRKGVQSLTMASGLMFQIGLQSVRVLAGRERGWKGLRNMLADFYKSVESGRNAPVSKDQALYVVSTKEKIQSFVRAQVGPGTG